jgi:hypothetical protein
LTLKTGTPSAAVTGNELRKKAANVAASMRIDLTLRLVSTRASAVSMCRRPSVFNTVKRSILTLTARLAAAVVFSAT